ncbi:MAG: hypothetical protein KC425_02100 [Anaerolineales bacterium]|nr:hypothetical protein [Anaerolineales bacterium]
MTINWTPPPPRRGLAGAWDRFIGPGARDAELWLQLLPTLAAPLLLLLYARQHSLGWSGWQQAVAALLAFDLVGGVITNATATAKRWYHRPGQGFAAHFGFVAVHFLHPLLVAWLFRGGDWAYFAASYLYLLLAAAAILALPLYLQRPAALACAVGGLALSLYAFTPTPGLEWFLPVFYLKLLVSHLLKEAPFAPPSSAG